VAQSIESGAAKVVENRLDFRRLNKILGMLTEKISLGFPEYSEVSLQWTYMHLFSCSQLIKIPAFNLGLSMELAAIAAALHDFGLLSTGIMKDHGAAGASLLDDFLNRYNNLYGKRRGIVTDEERGIIINAVRHHSEKAIYSSEPYLELLKDIDSLDRYLHGVPTDGAYLERVLKYMDVNTAGG